MSKATLDKMAKGLGIEIVGIDAMPELEIGAAFAQPVPGGPMEMVKNTYLTSSVYPDGTRNYLAAVTGKYHLEQHYGILEQILEECHSLPEFGKPGVELKFSPNGGRMWAKFLFPHIVNVGGKKVDDPIKPQIVVTNSADAKERLRLVYGAFRLICSNGMVIPDKRFPQSGKVNKLHKIGTLNVAKIIEGIKLGFSSFSEAIGLWKNYAKLEISSGQFVEALEVIGLSDKMGEKVLEQTFRGGSGTLLDRFRNGGRATGWDAYNAVTQFITDDVENPATNIDRLRSAGEYFDGLLLNNLASRR